MTSFGISRLCLFFIVLGVMLLQHFVSAQVNVALNKPTDQSTDLNFNGFDWTSDKAVDGCDLRDDSENQACCSCTQEDSFGDNFWSVDLGQQYLIQTVIVLGRSDTPTQLENFELFYKESSFSPELLVYNSLGVEYGDGNYTVEIDPPVPAQLIVIRRPGILTLCEILVFTEVQETSTAPDTTTEQQTTSEETLEPNTSTLISTESPTTTTESGCPPFTYGEFCIACGNCFNNEACNQADGSCPSGCAEGYFDTTCTSVCPGGLYGPNCLNVCGNCFLDAVCNAETGTCPLGCEPGWITSQCDQPCPEYSYGTNCESFCGNCLNAEPCNNVDGVCPSGCTPGWEGSLCDTLTPTTTTTVPTSTGTTQDTTQEEANVALGKPASQFSTLDYLFLWTADKAVDGCTLRDDPDNQQCCSATEGGFENFWTVDLQQQYLVSRIVVTGRTPDFSGQLEDFLVYIQQDEFTPELVVYNNAIEDYGDGIFTINLESPSLVQFVTIRRPSGTIMVICEVEVFGELPVTTTTAPTTTTTTTLSTESTTESSTEPITSSTAPSQTSSSSAPSTDGSTAAPITVNTNIAFNKPASQFSTLDYIFLWTADKAVDGCLLNDDPDNQQCCSATEGGAENFWTVDLGDQYLVYQIVVTGRTPDSSNQLEGFTVSTRQEILFPELNVYDNTGQPYGNGTFIIDIAVPSLVQFVTIRRPSGFILVLCEVEVYAIPDEPTTTTTTLQPTTTSTEPPSTTTEPCPINSYGDECTPCGNCLASIACNTVTGECPLGCEAGWQPPLCNTQCFPGFYGIDCLETCGNCQFGVPCDVITGACPGTCDVGWEGINCDSEITTTTVISTTTITEEQTTSQAEVTNIALGKLASQFSTLDYLFLWTADKAVDGCTLRDDPDNQQCCSATEGGFENFWTVDLQQQYLVSRIVVTGRTVDFSGQLEDFIVYIQQDEFSPELEVYNNTIEDYGDGIFTINLESPSLVQFVTIRRPSGTIMVICEVEVFGVIQDTTTTTPSTSTTSLTTTTTVIPTTTTDNIIEITTDSSSEDFSTATEITAQTNIALNKPASQFSTLDYLFLWTADKAVDGCMLRDDPDNQQCCSATEGGFENFWTVDLQQQYLVSRIIVTGRTPESSNQLENFEVYTRQELFFPELLVYSNGGQPYGNGTFVIDISEPSLVQFVTVKRPTGSIIVLCEVEVFAVIESQSTTVVATTPTTTTEQATSETTTVTTTTESCPTNTYGEGCIPCGNCLSIIPCNVETGECNFGCQAGWQPPLCNTACVAGTYGFDCSQTCGNCQFGAPCDVITGACPGACDPGWEGINCDSAIISTTTSTLTTVSSETSTVTTQLIETNIALGKPASQFQTVDYIFLWTADKAVDGCLLRDDPDNQQCCSATQGNEFENFWSVNLQDQYLVSRILVTGRTPDNSVQLEGFQIFTKETEFSSESLLYDNSVASYDYGIFNLIVEPPRVIQEVVVRRSTGNIIVLCEIEVLGVLSVVTSTTTTTPIVGGSDLTSTTITGPTTACPTNTWGEACTPCGNCVTFIPCDTTTGECAIGCLPGWQPPLCDTSCSAGFYGVDCLQTCGNCQFGVPCDVITGACPGGCDVGWEGINCDSAITTSTSTESTRTTEIPTTTEVQTTSAITETNIALGKPASQFQTVDYIFLWTADKAVDGCLLRDDPDNQQCCSATQGNEFENFWSVNLQDQYLVSRIIVTGRTPENSAQLEGFTLYTSETDFAPESILYNNGLEVYDDGIFEIIVEPPRITQVVTIRRATDTIIVLCEVEVFGVPFIPTTSTTTNIPTTSTTDIATTTTTATTVLPTTACPTNTWGEACTPCGNCVTFIPCDTTTGVCAVGCLPGWQPPLCDTSCSPGFYGVDCSQTCGNCQFGVPCDVITGACPGACDVGWEGIKCDSAITTSTSTEATTTETTTIEATTTKELQTTTEVTETNVALNKPASQFSTLDFIFLWTADKAVDGCTLRDDPDNQQCCSATEGGFENFWTIDLQQQYLVSRIVVIGRPPENSGQLEGFILYTRETAFSPESILYDNGLEVYDDGIFEINIDPPRIIQVVTIRRPTDSIIVICEVEVFGVPYVATTSSTTVVPITTSTVEVPTTTTTTLSTTVSTTPIVCPPDTYGDECTPCGNCLTFNSCNSVTGVCPIACAPGWQPPLCNTACEPGAYGIDCLQTCGNCQFGVPCDVITGACPGACDPGWEGINCDLAITSAPTTTTTTTQLPTTTEVIGTNVALGKPASQFSTLDYFFLWTADKAVDGCSLRDDPDNQQCCSATEGGFENFWTVDLQQQYLVSRIVVTGRLEANSVQLEAFQLYTRETQFSPEILLYDNVGDLYNDGIFNIDVSPQRIVQTVTVRRPSGTIIVLCEVEVFGVLIEETTTLSSTTAAEDTTSSLSPTFTASTEPSTQSTSGSTETTTQTSTEVSTQELTSASTQSSSQNPTSGVSESTQTPTSGLTSLSTQESISGQTSLSTRESTSGPTSILTQESTSGSTSMSTQGQTSESTQMSTQESTSGSTSESSQTGDTSTVTDQQTTQSTGPEQTGMLSTASSSASTFGPTLGSSIVPTQDDAEGPITGSTQSKMTVTTVMSTGGDMVTSLNYTQYDGSNFIRPTLAVLVVSVLLTIVCFWTT